MPASRSMAPLWSKGQMRTRNSTGREFQLLTFWPERHVILRRISIGCSCKRSKLHKVTRLTRAPYLKLGNLLAIWKLNLRVRCTTIDPNPPPNIARKECKTDKLSQQVAHLVFRMRMIQI